jgi:hypothetical protein
MEKWSVLQKEQRRTDQRAKLGRRFETPTCLGTVEHYTGKFEYITAPRS